MKKLTEKQMRFADEYLIDLNATQAYLRAGYRVSEGVAAVNGKRLLEKPQVERYVAERQSELRRATEITQERVLLEFARIAFFDARRLFESDGAPRPIGALDNDTAACIVGLDVLEVYEGNGADREFVGYMKKYRIADKKGALDSLARHLGLFNKDHLSLGGSLEVRKGELGEILKQLQEHSTG